MNPLTWDAPWAVVALALFGIVMLRANATYWLGRAIGTSAARWPRAQRLMSSTGYAKVVRWISRWGAPVVSVSFLTIGVQTMVNLAAGATGMKQRHYLPAVTVGCVLWALIYSTVGFVGFRAFSALHDRSPLAAWAVVGIAAVAFAAFVITRTKRERLQGSATPDPATQDPATQDPAIQDPGIQDPAIQN